jgi:hypothetical protein
MNDLETSLAGIEREARRWRVVTAAMIPLVVLALCFGRILPGPPPLAARR